ncbi:MAG: PLP-dependent aminotransferase family protein [Bryobacteraceae bacterium]
MVAFPEIAIDQSSDAPVYRQIADAVALAIGNGKLHRGQRLPATRELAGHLGMNRATISAAYALLEESGLIQGHVGRGSFVSEALESSRASRSQTGEPPAINFASSRPAGEAFPLASFRRLSRAVIESDEASEILQLGSPYGYTPLRRYLLEKSRADGIATAGDDILITNGCQQALDLLARSFTATNTKVVCEDPVYHGLLRVFGRSGCQVMPVPVGPHGLDLDLLEPVLLQHRPALIVVTPSYQNPTGATMPADVRRRLAELASASGAVIVESDIYSELRYEGEPVPTVKQSDGAGRTLLLGSYSKISFPGLRVGWVIGPREMIAQMAEEKQVSDLHSDQLSQAVLLRFAQSGELDRHVDRTRDMGRQRLDAALESCQAFLPEGCTWTRPAGGMNLWITLPAPLGAETLLAAARHQGVDFVPGRQFSLTQGHARSLRISFGGLSPEKIRQGLRIVGEAAKRQVAASLNTWDFEPAMALV